MKGFYLDEVSKIGAFIQAIKNVEDKFSMHILTADNEIWVDGDCVAKVNYDETGTLKVFPQ